MTTFRRGTGGSPTARHAAAALGAVVALGLLTACGDGSGNGGNRGGGSEKTGSASASSAPGGGTSTGANTASGKDEGAGANTASGKNKGAATNNAVGTRCNASELRGHVGRNEPGAGQENFPLVVTNFSGRTCTLYGYPGAAFVDGSGGQLGPDPVRVSGGPAKITLAPGKSAWAGLSFGNPEISGARTATPNGIEITPPDEKESVKVDWTAGRVPVSEAAKITVFRAGNGG